MWWLITILLSGQLLQALLVSWLGSIATSRHSALEFDELFIAALLSIPAGDISPTASVLQTCEAMTQDVHMQLLTCDHATAAVAMGSSEQRPRRPLRTPEDP